MRGRKPKPTALHRLQGTFDATRHGRDRKNEPIAHGELTGPPSWMTAEQQEAWKCAVEHAPAGVLKKIDVSVLSVWIIAYDQHRIAAEQQAKIDMGTALPLLTHDKHGLPVASPYLGIMNKAGLRLLKAASELGFTPATRPRMAAGIPAPTEDGSPWDRFAVIDGGRLES